MNDDGTLLDFPCVFPIKAMGYADRGFEALVVEIVRRHAPDLNPERVATRSSRGGMYVAVTVSITATSRRQLDAIYSDLTRHESVKYAL